MLKRLMVFLVITCILLVFFSCKKSSTDDPAYPNIAGTWTWVLTFTTNTCGDEAQETSTVVVTQTEGSGTATIYDIEDTNHTCPIIKCNYTIDTNGNMTVNETVAFDPNQCVENGPSPGTTININMTLTGTSTLISGSFTFIIAFEEAECQQIGTCTCSKQILLLSD